MRGPRTHWRDRKLIKIHPSLSRIWIINAPRRKSSALWVTFSIFLSGIMRTGLQGAAWSCVWGRALYVDGCSTGPLNNCEPQLLLFTSSIPVTHRHGPTQIIFSESLGISSSLLTMVSQSLFETNNLWEKTMGRWLIQWPFQRIHLQGRIPKVSFNYKDEMRLFCRSSHSS